MLHSLHMSFEVRVDLGTWQREQWPHASDRLWHGRVEDHRRSGLPRRCQALHTSAQPEMGVATPSLQSSSSGQSGHSVTPLPVAAIFLDLPAVFDPLIGLCF